MIFILEDIIDDGIRIRNNAHIETEKEFKIGIVLGDREECRDTRGSPSILADVEGETIDSGGLGDRNVVRECCFCVWVCVSHHKMAEDMFVSRGRLSHF